MRILPDPGDPRKQARAATRTALLDLEWSVRQLRADDPAVQELEQAILAVQVALDALEAP